MSIPSTEKAFIQFSTKIAVPVSRGLWESHALQISEIITEHSRIHNMTDSYFQLF